MEARNINIQWQNSKNVKINNIETSALIEDTSDTLTYFADKYIITKYKLVTGDLVEYAGITYMVVSQIDRNIEDRKEQQYNYRARIRQVDHSIKVVLDGKVEIFSSIIEGQTFNILEGQLISTSGDKIIVTLKSDDIANKIKKEMRFIKLGQAWKIEGIDKSKNGLITLFCKSHLFDTINDDIENEIANKNLINDIPVEPEEPEGLIIIGADRFTIWDKDNEYTVNTTKPVIWTLNRTDIIKIISTVDNKCFINPVGTSKIGLSVLRCTLVEDDTIFVEKDISLFYQ